MLLVGGTTAHYLFGLPYKLTTSAQSSIHMESHRAAVLKSAHVLIMDEVSMLNKEHLRVIDTLLRVICNNVRPFGGKIILFGGDFGQLQPVVTGEC